MTRTFHTFAEMILGVGIDQIEVSRVKRKIEDKGFLSKVFSDNEIDYCLARGVPAQHFAARFAAKEAMLKALGVGLTGGFELSNISVESGVEGKPHICLKGRVKDHCNEQKIRKIHVSMSHLKDIASAIVILEK